MQKNSRYRDCRSAMLHSNWDYYIVVLNELQDKILQKITKNEKKYQKSDYYHYGRRVCRVNRYFSRVYATRIAGTEKC